MLDCEASEEGNGTALGESTDYDVVGGDAVFLHFRFDKTGQSCSGAVDAGLIVGLVELGEGGLAFSQYHT